MMKFAKLSAPSLKDLFIREIEGMILSGKLPIGSRLPTERELSASMGVSRAVVNSGLIEMTRKGFVEMKPRVGAIVADYRRRGTTETLTSIMHYNGGVLPKADIKSLLEFRIVFETLALELSVPRATKDDLKRLKAIAEGFSTADTPAAAAQAIYDFHHEISMISGNTILPIIFYSFSTLQKMLWTRYFELYGYEKLQQTTLELYRLIEKGDTKGAIANLTNSINETISGKSPIYYE